MLLQPDATGTLVTAGELGGLGLPQQALAHPPPPPPPSPGPRTLHYLSRDQAALKLLLGPLGADMRPAKLGAQLPAVLLLVLALSARFPGEPPGSQRSTRHGQEAEAVAVPPSGRGRQGF